MAVGIRVSPAVIQAHTSYYLPGMALLVVLRDRYFENLRFTRVGNSVRSLKTPPPDIRGAVNHKSNTTVLHDLPSADYTKPSGILTQTQGRHFAGPPEQAAYKIVLGRAIGVGRSAVQSQKRVVPCLVLWRGKTITLYAPPPEESCVQSLGVL